MVEIMAFLKWAVQSGLLPAGTAVMLAVFSIVVILNDRRRSADFKSGLSSLEKAYDETKAVWEQKSDQDQVHIKNCDNRYEILRTDMGNLQKHVQENHDTVMREVLNELRKR